MNMILTPARGTVQRVLPACICCCTLVLLLCAAGISPVSGAQYTVAPSGGDFTNIQNAVTWASPLDTVIVRSGTYPGTVKIDKKITLLGVNTGGGPPVIDPGKKGTAIEIDADGCTVEGFTLQNSASANGILVSANENTIANNTITGNVIGIHLSSAEGNSIVDNTIMGSSSAGLVLRNAKNNLIEGNRITKNSLGLQIDETSTGNTITFNSFANTANVLVRNDGEQWESPAALSYVYMGSSFTGKLGNYWSDYQGNDQNADGIGDTPYVVATGLPRSSGNGILQDVVDPAPLMDPIDYYHQIRPASSGAGPVPAIPAASGAAVPSAERTPANPPLSGGPERTDRPVVTGLLILIVICIVAAGGVLYLRSRKTRRDRMPGEPAPAGDTRPRQVLDLQAQEEVPRNPLPVQPRGPTVTTPTPETEVATPARESSPSAGPKFYFPPELENRYMDIRHIGRGGVAQVFAAHRKSDNLLVAVKIPISFDEVTGKCFLNEIAAWQTLRHKNIVEVLEVNILPVPYVEMEYVPGSLESIEKPLPVWKAVHLVHGIANGLAYAHAHGIIHRDIKPHNILVSGDFVPKITDWGMSKVIATTMEKSSVAGFSLSYAAPEQVSPAEFGRTDIRTDIYQLGALFYELVTGSIPFGGDSIVEVGNAIVREDPIPPTDYNPAAEAVEKIILTCLAKNPADRYQSATELLDALSRYLDEDDE